MVVTAYATLNKSALVLISSKKKCASVVSTLTSVVLVVYNEYYDNVPLGYYRYLFEALSKEYG